MKKLTYIFCSLVIIASAGCGSKTDQDKVADAQACLDDWNYQNPPYEISTCTAKIEGLESASADLIRCSAELIQEGFSDPSRLSSAISKLDSGSGSTQTLEYLGVMSFRSGSSAAVNLENAAKAQQLCDKSGSKGLILLASAANIATLFCGGSADVNNGCTISVSSLTNLLTSGTSSEQIGNAAISLVESNCANGSNSASGSFCEQFNSAISSAGGTENAAEIGELILTCYSNPTLDKCKGYN